MDSARGQSRFATRTGRRPPTHREVTKLCFDADNCDALTDERLETIIAYMRNHSVFFMVICETWRSGNYEEENQDRVQVHLGSLITPCLMDLNKMHRFHMDCIRSILGLDLLSQYSQGISNDDLLRGPRASAHLSEHDWWHGRTSRAWSRPAYSVAPFFRGRRTRASWSTCRKCSGSACATRWRKCRQASSPC